MCCVEVLPGVIPRAITRGCAQADASLETRDGDQRGGAPAPSNQVSAKGCIETAVGDRLLPTRCWGVS